MKPLLTRSWQPMLLLAPCCLLLLMASGCASTSHERAANSGDLDKSGDQNPYWLFDKGTTFYSPGDPNAWFH